MANGLPNLLPFPKFGGEKSPGITSVKLQPAPIRFPTASRPVSAKAPAEVNPFAAIAPFLLRGLGNYFFPGEPSPAPVPTPTDVNEAYTLEEIQNEILKGDEARYEADKLYGPSRELSGWQKWGRMALENLPALAYKDPRELSAFTSTSSALNKIRSAGDLARTDFIGNYTTAQLAKVLNVTPAFNIDDSSIARSSIEGPNGGFYILSMGKKEDKTVDGTKVDKGEYYRSPNWIIGEPPRSDTLRSSGADSKKDWMKERDKLETAASALRAATPIINDIIENIMVSPEMTTTYLGPVLRFANNLKAVGADLGLYSPEVINGDNLSWLDQKTGKVSEAFLNTDVIPYEEQVMGRDGKMKTVMKELNFEKMFGSKGNDAEFRSAMINLAYLAAAANGQTGRTLSDKDLALHLEQLGASFGEGNKGPRNAPGAIRALNTWYNKQLSSNSIKMREHERNSLASDYRIEYGEDTPWAERWLTGRKDDRTGAQILYNIPQAWLLEEKDSDQNFYFQYLMTLVAARKRYGLEAVKRDPIPGLDWEGDFFNYYQETLDDLKGGTVGPGGYKLPPVPRGKPPGKNRTKVG